MPNIKKLKMGINIWAKIISPGRAQFSALQLFFLCFPAMLFAQASTSDIHKAAATYYRLPANQGFAPAQYKLATLFQAGHGVHRDYKQALTWYRKAADQSFSAAEKEVGYFYQCGLGVKRDYAQALAWYRRAADHGNTDAENQLGYMAEEGWGQPQNYEEALSWYYKAAEHGSAQAQENIGYMVRRAGTGCINAGQQNRLAKG